MLPDTSVQIPGYSYSAAELDRSPVSQQALAELKASVLFGPDDEQALRMAGETLADQVEDVLDVWYGFVGSHPHLVAYFATPEGEPIAEYLQRVRGRFGQWILDTCNRPYDQAWLDYQHEIALRHTEAKKNRTDDVTSVPLHRSALPDRVHLPDHGDDAPLPGEAGTRRRAGRGNVPGVVQSGHVDRRTLGAAVCCRTVVADWRS